MSDAADGVELTPRSHERLRLFESGCFAFTTTPVEELRARGIVQTWADERRFFDRPLHWLLQARDAPLLAFWRLVEERHAASEADLADTIAAAAAVERS